jgi:molybdopterin-guanine dinucleotide biosynthesis protein
MSLTTVAIGGFTSNAGKTTLVCELLRHLPGWEAIKQTRGHYRSCGKDPHACCVSHLLGDAPVLRSGRAETYTPGKDTGRYWDAGAANVHWLIATDKQVAQGIRQALGRVRAGGVLVEGNSFQPHVPVDFAIMVVPQVIKQIKPTARRALARCDALYLFTEEADDELAARARFAAWCHGAADGELLQQIPAFTHSELPALLTRMCELPAAVSVS